MADLIDAVLHTIRKAFLQSAYGYILSSFLLALYSPYALVITAALTLYALHDYLSQILDILEGFSHPTRAFLNSVSLAVETLFDWATS